MGMNSMRMVHIFPFYKQMEVKKNLEQMERNQIGGNIDCW